MVSKAEKVLLRELRASPTTKFGREVRRLGGAQPKRKAPKQKVARIPIQQPIQEFPQQVRRQPQPRRGGTGITNFFAHGSDKEVFGDDTLTFFDSQKAQRISGSTADFFGI